MGARAHATGSLLVILADCGVYGPSGNQSLLTSKSDPLARRYMPCRNSITTPQSGMNQVVPRTLSRTRLDYRPFSAGCQLFTWNFALLGCDRDTVADFTGSYPGGSGRRSLGSLPMVHRMGKTIGKLTLAAATRSRIAAVRAPTTRPPASFDGSLPPYFGRTPLLTFASFLLSSLPTSGIIFRSEAPLMKLRRMRWSPMWAGQMRCGRIVPVAMPKKVARASCPWKTTPGRAKMALRHMGKMPMLRQTGFSNTFQKGVRCPRVEINKTEEGDSR